jgi:hypothetical protein
VILLWSNFEDIKCGSVDEKSVDEDFVCIMQELRIIPSLSVDCKKVSIT